MACWPLATLLLSLFHFFDPGATDAFDTSITANSMLSRRSRLSVWVTTIPSNLTRGKSSLTYVLARRCISLLQSRNQQGQRDHRAGGKRLVYYSTLIFLRFVRQPCTMWDQRVCSNVPSGSWRVESWKSSKLSLYTLKISGGGILGANEKCTY